MIYEGDIYRPPSEAYSLIIQITVGCSHNKCTFCNQFIDKQFHVRKPEAVIADLREMRQVYSYVGRIFLADGDALCLATPKLLLILNTIRDLFPECQRVGIFGRADHVAMKSDAELKQLKDAGLGIVYLGAESGNPEVLRRVNKKETREVIIESVRRLEETGIPCSVTFISGLGGQELSMEHAVDTGTMITEMSPSYASLLTLIIRGGEPICDEIRSGSFKLLTQMQLLDETEVLIKNINLKNKCVFRSNHASNYLVLKGDLPYDKERFLEQIKEAKGNSSMLRSEFFRAL